MTLLHAESLSGKANSWFRKLSQISRILTKIVKFTLFRAIPHRIVHVIVGTLS
jgi:hypothetical protein